MIEIGAYLAGLSQSRIVLSAPMVRRLLLHPFGRPIITALRAVIWAALAASVGSLLVVIGVPGGLLLLSGGPLGAAALAGWTVSRSFEHDCRRAGRR